MTPDPALAAAVERLEEDAKLGDNPRVGVPTTGVFVADLRLVLDALAKAQSVAALLEEVERERDEARQCVEEIAGVRAVANHTLGWTNVQRAQRFISVAGDAEVTK